MTTHHTTRGSKRYCYYVCQTAQKEGARACPGSRVAAGKLEAFVVDRLREMGRDPAVLEATLEADRRDREARRPELEAEAVAEQIEQVRAELAAPKLGAVDTGGLHPKILVRVEQSGF